jgi:hypothetical protein
LDAEATMIWMKRRFPDLGYVPYMDRLESLLHEMPNSYSEFLMFWMETGKFGNSGLFYRRTHNSTASGFRWL